MEFFFYKDDIPVDDLGITAKELDQHKFTIWYKKRNLKSYKLETREPAVRSAWVEEITSLLWEQAMQKKGKNIIRTGTKLIPNKQLITLGTPTKHFNSKLVFRTLVNIRNPNSGY